MKPRALLVAVAVWAGLLASPALAASSASPYADWAAVFVAGDWRGHSGGETETFDNARRDLAQAFEQAGFAHQNIRQFSVRPERYPDAAPFPSDIQTIADALTRLTAEAKGGCLVYFTSHGSPDGAVVGRQLLAPRLANRIIGQACGARPTVVVISACFSGVFVPELAGANRMVLTAARPDRSSFGCGESDRYPYFDACMLESLPHAPDFAALGRQAQACVARKEKETGAAPPSEPQVAVGGELRPVLPLLAFNRVAEPTGAAGGARTAAVQATGR